MNTSYHRGDEPILSDDELAVLERAIEAGEDLEAAGDLERQNAHRSAFELIDKLAAPIRLAIESNNSPPKLEDYEELTEIARGGMGVVYRGLHRKTQRYDAIKVMRPDRIAGAARETAILLRLQFLRESQLAARVAHEHIVPIYQVGESQDRPWFSMQLVDGSSLYELSQTASVSAERMVRYIQQIARAVDVVHRHGILHGDIKPQNILVEHQTDRPLIGDFGLADLAAASSNRPDAGIAGTPAYMAPELARAAIQGQSKDDIAATRSVSTDVYSLGVTLWAAITGRSPCDSNRTPAEQLADVAISNLRCHNEKSIDVPPALMRIIKRCVSRDPESRYSNAGQFADELATWLNRPHWNRHFPQLRRLLWVVVAPILLSSGLMVQSLLSMKANEFWIWLAIFGGYAPLFATFLFSQRIDHVAQQARRELWSIWVGHLCVSLAGMIALHILCEPEVDQVIKFFYPFWAAISALTFFAKSGNFWSGYRWLGVAWSLIAVLLSVTPWAPVVFGTLAATTCLVIARTDRSFLEK